MRDLHKAIAVVIGCSVAMSFVFLAAYCRHRHSLTTAEVLAATRVAVDEAVMAAIENGGLHDSEDFLGRLISRHLAMIGFPDTSVSIVRENDFDPLAAFHFDIVAGGVSARYRLDGVRDPLLAIRLGLHWIWREDPHHPYEIHRISSVMSDCLTNHYFHLADDAPDFFARLENRTEDRYHYGVESFIVAGGQPAVDHLLLGGKGNMDDAHRAKYGLP